MTAIISPMESIRSDGSRVRRGPRYRPHLTGASVEFRLASRDGRSPSTWHKEIYGEAGCFAKSRLVLEELLAIADRSRAMMLLGQLTAVFLPPSVDPRAAVQLQDIADANEDVRQAAVPRTPDWIKTATPVELEAWERGLREQADASVTLADVIRRERESRRGIGQ